MTYKHKNGLYQAEPMEDDLNDYRITQNGKYIGEAYQEFFENSDDWQKVDNPWVPTVISSSVSKLQRTFKHRKGTKLYFNEVGIFSYSLEEILNYENCKIQTVSNGKEEFSVGDVIKYKVPFQPYASIKRIQFFTLDDKGRIHVETREGESFDNMLLEKDDKISKAEVLYTTEDGIKRYESQDEWWIRKNSDGKWVFCDVPVFIMNGAPLLFDKIFSTKEAAEKWMEKNNPKPERFFITEDGAKLRLGDTFYCVFTKNIPYSINKGTINDQDIFKQKEGYPNYKCFSTKDLAEDYSKRYQKVFSYEDIVKITMKVTKRDREAVERLNFIVKELRNQL